MSGKSGEVVELFPDNRQDGLKGVFTALSNYMGKPVSSVAFSFCTLETKGKQVFSKPYYLCAVSDKEEREMIIEALHQTIAELQSES